MTFDDIRKANESIKTTDIKGKEYAEVNQRIKAFRMVFPDGFIITDMQSNENGVCIFTARVGYYTDGINGVVIGTGTAYEREDSSYINKTSYIENCETSAVGRALGMAGFGIDTSVASYEEVSNAILNQGDDAPWDAPAPIQRSTRKASQKQVDYLRRLCKNNSLFIKEILDKYNIGDLSELTADQASEEIKKRA